MGGSSGMESSVGSDSSTLMQWGSAADDAAVPGVMDLSASYGWCLSDGELTEMQSYEDELLDVVGAYLGDDEKRRVRLGVEIAYQSRSWASETRSVARLSHAVAVASVLGEQKMEADAVIAALLAGVPEETGLTLKQINEMLGPRVGSAVRDLTNVWKLSELLESAPADDAEQLERRSQMVLAGCDDWRGVVLALASRLVSVRQLQGDATLGESATAADDDELEEAADAAAAAEGFAEQTLQASPRRPPTPSSPADRRHPALPPTATTQLTRPRPRPRPRPAGQPPARPPEPTPK